MTAQTVSYRCPHCNQTVDVDLNHEHDLLICPNPACQKPFKVDVPVAHPSSELILPPGVHEEVQTTPAPVAAPAGAEEEKGIVKVRLAMFRRYPWRCLAYGLGIIAGIILGVYYLLTGWHLFTLVFLAIAVVCAYRLGSWWLRMEHVALTVTNKRCVLETGVLEKKVTEIPMSDLVDIVVRQSFLQRWLKVGDITLVSHKGDAHRILVMAVPYPQSVAGQIREERCERKA
jgi:uncharacterized membrane protein YdbT with pleckstrin-like domain